MLYSQRTIQKNGRLDRRPCLLIGSCDLGSGVAPAAGRRRDYSDCFSCFKDSLITSFELLDRTVQSSNFGSAELAVAAWLSLTALALLPHLYLVYLRGSGAPAG